MRDPYDLRTMRAVSALLGIQVEAARHELHQAEGLFREASREVLTGRAERDDALDEWHGTLGSDRPDPGQFGRSGARLVDRQARLRAAELDESIAQARRDERTSALAETLARERVGSELADRLERLAARVRRERRQQDAIDLHRNRSHPCRSR